MPSATHDANDVAWWGASPERIEWLQQQVARQPIDSAWAGATLKQIQLSKQPKDETEMNINERYPNRLVRGQDLKQPIVALITGVRDEEMAKGAGKKPEPVLCIYFENVTTGKPVRMPTHAYTTGLGHAFSGRKTLAKQIAELLGSYDTDEWVGKRIEIYAIDTTAGKDRVKSIAARLPADKPAQKQQAPATLEERKAKLLVWFDGGGRINANNAADIDAKVADIAKEIGYTFDLEDGHNNPSGRLAALVEHLKAQPQAVIEAA